MSKPRSLRFLWSVVLLATFADAQSATSLTLTPSQNPSIFGHAVTLTAAVTSGATGKVTFYDGVNMLGTSTISGSQAVFTTVLLPAGTRQLHAHYLGTSGYAPSNSAVVMVTVAAQPSTAFQPRLGISIGARLTLVGDFSGDGKQDMFVYGAGDTAFILSGNGDGTFQAPLYQNVGSLPQAAAIGDFNGDGKTDLAILSSSDNSLNLYLGNGDGTFGLPMTSSFSLTSATLSVADFNGDGNADLLVAGSGYPNNMGVLLGNGDGTFQAMTAFASPSNSVASVAIGDFNGDGIADIATAGNFVYGSTCYWEMAMERFAPRCRRCFLLHMLRYSPWATSMGTESWTWPLPKQSTRTQFGCC